MCEAKKSTLFTDEEYRKLQKRRSRYAWSFASVSFLSLVIFIGLATWAPDLYARQLFSSGFFTAGMAAGLAILIICIVLTAAYLHRCNVEFDPARKEMLGKRNEN